MRKTLTLLNAPKASFLSAEFGEYMMTIITAWNCIFLWTMIMKAKTKYSLQHNPMDSSGSKEPLFDLEIPGLSHHWTITWSGGKRGKKKRRRRKVQAENKVKQLTCKAANKLGIYEELSFWLKSYFWETISSVIWSKKLMAYFLNSHGRSTEESMCFSMPMACHLFVRLLRSSFLTTDKSSSAAWATWSEI